MPSAYHKLHDQPGSDHHTVGDHVIDKYFFLCCALPFLSYGGSSMLSMAVAIGLVLSISKSAKEEYVNKKVKHK